LATGDIIRQPRKAELSSGKIHGKGRKWRRLGVTPHIFRAAVVYDLRALYECAPCFDFFNTLIGQREAIFCFR